MHKLFNNDIKIYKFLVLLVENTKKLNNRESHRPNIRAADRILGMQLILLL